jgi:hypothetical protein
VPANATRLANLPAGKNYALIAVAPWFSPQCVVEYFTAARQVPTKGVLVWQPGQGDATPPVLNDPSWSLQDGGSWQKANTFPTYALAANIGDQVMKQMGLYSGNLTDVPYGDQLSQTLDDSDYVRLWATVSTENGAQLPSLWVFLVIVLAILIVAISGTSVAMHVIQRRRRNSLRRRVLDGEVDLEALGVKRLNVSQQILDKLPVYTYTTHSTNEPEKNAPQAPPLATIVTPAVDAESGVKESPLVRHASAPTAPGAPTPTLNQPTCPICLDDFEANETQVRELPCRHIFHLDCIDTFLLRNSSLCPMCKQSVLPPGACPVTITNMMVRRERHINRMRARSANTANAQPGTTMHSSPPPSSPPHGPLGSLGRRIGVGRRIFSASERTQPRPNDIEMANNSSAVAAPTPSPNPAAADVTPAPPPPPPSSTRLHPHAQPERMGPPARAANAGESPRSGY